MEKKTDDWDVAEHAAFGEYNEKCRLLGKIAQNKEEIIEIEAIFEKDRIDDEVRLKARIDKETKDKKARISAECVKKQDEAYEEFEVKRKRIREDRNVKG